MYFLDAFLLEGFYYNDVIRNKHSRTIDETVFLVRDICTLL